MKASRRYLLLASAALTLLSAVVLAPSASALGPFVKLSAEMTQQRYAPAAATLPNGKVLVSGGYESGSAALDTAELFDPGTGTFATLAAAPTSGRGEACYATLSDGRVLIAGGASSTTDLKTAEVFDPATETFQAVGEMAVERDGCAAATLPSGKVLVVAGLVGNKGPDPTNAELFDPATNTFESIAAEIPTALYEPAAVSLASGQVLLAGGFVGGTPQSTAQIFDPVSGKFRSAPHELVEGRGELAYLPASGGALLLGGYRTSDLSSIELFNGQTESFEGAGTTLAEVRDGGAAARLQNGSVLVLGGANASANLRSAELAPRTLLPTTAASSAPGALAGTVVAELPASAHFQYGTSTAYGSSTPAQALPPSPAAAEMKATLTGLLPGTTYHYRLVAEDAGGPAYGADVTFTTASLPVAPILSASLPLPIVPLISGATQSHSKWREGNALARVSRRRKRSPIGTTFSFTLNEQATVSLTFTQRVSGRKLRGKCVAQTKANKRKRSCRRTVTAGSLLLAGHAGKDRISFQGRISSAKKLKPGTYVLTLVATNTAGQRSAPRQLTFTIVK